MVKPRSFKLLGQTRDLLHIVFDFFYTRDVRTSDSERCRLLSRYADFNVNIIMVSEHYGQLTLCSVNNVLTLCSLLLSLRKDTSTLGLRVT